MRLPEKLTQRINELLENVDNQTLIKMNALLTQSYHAQKWHLGKTQQMCYAAARMPATYTVISHLTKHLKLNTVLDVGAGPGTASFALNCDVTAVEHDKGFIELGQQLEAPCSWVEADYKSYEPTQAYDLVLFSYSYGESKALNLAPYFESCQQLLIIEPGTPMGWKNILRARDDLLSLGAHIHAPCPHSNACPLKDPDWCHFGVKLERSEIHKLIKQATLGYEEEKFSYLLVGKEPHPCGSRLLRPTQKRPGHIHLKLCTTNGLEQKIVTKKQSDLFAWAKKAKWGDAFDVQDPTD